MKTLLKFIAGFFVGGVLGYIGGSAVPVLLGDVTWTEYWQDIANPAWLGYVALFSVGVVLAVMLHIVLHEAGHLVCGLLTGFKFLSFRIGSLTLVRDGKGYGWRHYSLAGTGGQCLMAPPDKPADQINLTWYNLGGVLANVVTSLLLVAAAAMAGNAEVKFVLVMSAILGFASALLNGIPFGANDGAALRGCWQSAQSRHDMIDLLRCNADLMAGKLPSELTGEWLARDDEPDYCHNIQVNLELCRLAYWAEHERWPEVQARLQRIVAHEKQVASVLLLETKCELAYTALRLGDTDQARQLLDKQLMAYVDAGKTSSTSKQRLLCAKALLLDGDREAAQAVAQEVERNLPGYLVQGEAHADLATMRKMLAQHQSLQGE